MKKITKSKYFIGGIIVGLSFLSFGTYALTGAGTLGNLFNKKTDHSTFDETNQYRLHGDAIADGTLDSTEIENDSIKSEDIRNGEITNDDVNSFYSLWNKNIDSSLYYNLGNVGIGINSPSAQLELKGDAKIRLNGADNDDYWDLNAYDNGTHLNFNRNSTTNMRLYDNGNIYVRGNVGIGTSSPSQKLTIEGGDIEIKADTPRVKLIDSGELDKYIELRYQSGWGRINTDGSNIYTSRMFRADGGLRVGDDEGFFRYAEDIIKTDDSFVVNGNVGIGTSSPRSKVEVKTSSYQTPAFMAGYKINDGVTAGYSSIAMGYNTKTSGNYGTSMGRDTESRGYSSTSMGYYTEASSHYSTILGRYGQTASDDVFSVAYGDSGDQNTAGEGLVFQVKRNGDTKATGKIYTDGKEVATKNFLSTCKICIACSDDGIWHMKVCDGPDDDGWEYSINEFCADDGQIAIKFVCGDDSYSDDPTQ